MSSHGSRPCDRCGRPCTTGSNTRDVTVCRDCRAADPHYLQLVTANTRTKEHAA